MTDYQNPIPVAVCLVPVRHPDGRLELLGVVRANDPGRGCLALPGGYVDKGESAEMAASRELKEECGLIVATQDWQLQHSRITAENRMLLFALLRYEIPAGQVDFHRPPCSEVQQVICLRADSEVEWETHKEAVRRFLSPLG